MDFFKIDNLKQFVQENPESILFARLGDELLKSGKIVEAISICESGTKTNPDYAPGFFVLSLAYRRLRRKGDAANAMKQAVLLDPNYRRLTVDDLQSQKPSSKKSKKPEKKPKSNPKKEAKTKSKKAPKPASKEASPKPKEEPKNVPEEVTPVPMNITARMATMTMVNILQQQGNLKEALQVLEMMKNKKNANVNLIQKKTEEIQNLLYESEKS
ncbi:MAG: hypothetical protein ISS00_01230 [Candidatus Marinimicrobia bacterium]|nr:hypothetical protein [Candidatus Neomarinimicrobiota bacterium]